ncbi:MAG TPA: trypsin-like peptidase domain-containing protein, partial [bacterium]|nr:trypsin-like peptidase domain-containing protein [bacterium]
MLPTGFGEIGEKLRRSTVQVQTHRQGQGSGLIVSADGFIVTNSHVATSPAATVQLWDGSTFDAKLVSRDAVRDLALLRIAKSGLPAAELADSDRLRVGELVIAIGNPMGFIGALTTGVVHAIGRIGELGPWKWIQSDVRLAPGNSGGPLANSWGRVVGINTMVARGLGLAIPSNNIAKLLDVQAAGAPLGVLIRPTPMLVDGKHQLGMLVLEVLRDSAAERASLMVGDILTAADDTEFHSLD